MNSKYLDFEQPVAELQAKIDELRNVGSDNAINLDEEIQRLQSKMRQQIKDADKKQRQNYRSQIERFLKQAEIAAASSEQALR